MLTYEVGSLLKPKWRVESYTQDFVSDVSFAEAMEWGERLGIDNYEDLVKTLNAPSSPERNEEVLEWSIIYALRLLENSGLDYVYSGEMGRREMYEHLARGFPCFSFFDSEIQSLDYAYYNKGAIIEKPVYQNPIYLTEFQLTKKHARKPLKVPVTGPYTTIAWSFNDFYERNHRKKITDWKSVDFNKLKMEARGEALLDFVKIYRKEIDTLICNGADWIQIDEPAITTYPQREEMEFFTEAINQLTRGFPAKFSLHNCFSDYKVLAEYSPQLKDVDELSLEFANRDTLKLGVDESSRPAYEDLKFFEEYGYQGKFGLGVIHVHDYDGNSDDGAEVRDHTVVESPELVRDRILYASKIVGIDRINPATDCGLRRKPWYIVQKKLSSLEAGRNLVIS
ncbi:MAG TPA: hypothetical protein VKK79_17125 [Candidatus Lokiarchaeia archaeon]|nr:hypothetical protein [Candidatus Lokiarchaeia archaeon]